MFAETVYFCGKDKSGGIFLQKFTKFTKFTHFRVRGKALRAVPEPAAFH